MYTGPLSVAKNTTIRALARAPGAPDSALSAAGYNIQAPPPPPPPPPPARVVVTGTKLELKDKVYFDTARASIKAESNSLLDEAAAVLKNHPEVKKVVIEGHTDNRGGTAKNLKLSEARAQAVKAYLVGKGVEAGRLDAKGYGETKPIADNKTEKGRDANRRVEFMIAQ
ncbi:MAG: OmpA family protein [Deltaproteobacteria bacterium]|nr:OmpA family protein [Deltaproteobacteria bacterium]